MEKKHQNTNKPESRLQQQNKTESNFIPRFYNGISLEVNDFRISSNNKTSKNVCKTTINIHKKL